MAALCRYGHTEGRYSSGKCRACSREQVAAYYRRTRPARLEYYHRQKEKNQWRAFKGHLKRTFGLTIEAYDAMLSAQHGCCAICGSASSGSSKRGWHVDHCHETG